jgi:hypothetical protein
MKKFILKFLGVLLLAGAAMAQEAPTAHPLYLGIGTGVDLPGSNWDSNYLAGGGAQGFAGYNLDKNWAAQLGLEEWFFTGGGTSLFNFRVLAEAKYTFDGAGWQPYLLAGPGLVFQALSPTGDTASNFDALAGVGAQFDLAPQAKFFLEAKYNFILPETGSYQDVPVDFGLLVGI